MIHLIDDYYVQVTDTCYISGKTTLKTDKKTGETTLAFIKPKYYSNIKNAILGACEVRKVEELSKMSCELLEAVEELKRIQATFEALLDKALN